MSHRNRRRRQRPRTDFDAEPGAPLWQRISAAGWLLLGLAFGLSGGLYYAWIVNPVVYVDASPARFSPRYKEEYIFLVSQSYAATGNWPQAEQRLAALDDPGITQTVSNLLETYLRQQEPAPEIRNLAALARQLGAEGGAVALFAPTSELQPTPTEAVVATPTPAPTTTPTPAQTSIPPTATRRATSTPQPNYRLVNQQRICDPEGDIRHIGVITVDAFLNPLPGIEVLVTWPGGSDRFFTGFKPAAGEGYGDFTMSPDTSYTVALADGSPEISGLRIEPCDSGFDGGWQLTFQNLRGAATATPEP